MSRLRDGIVQRGDQDDDEHERRQRVDDLDHAHHEIVDAPAGVAADHAVGDADGEADDASPTAATRSEIRAP